MRSSGAAPDPAKSGAKYTVRTRCPQCGRKHITVFRVRHVSDSFHATGALLPLHEAR
jgi:ribosomal protein L44E